MKRTLIATVAATAAILAAAYLTGADSTTAPAPAQTNASSGTQAQMQTQMQGPMTETETIECDDYILLIPCPVCHTCPVCQSNCGTAHALRCCLGNKKPASGTSAASGASGMPAQQHVMTNKAEAVKHAASRTATTPPAQTETGTLSIITVESD